MKQELILVKPKLSTVLLERREEIKQQIKQTSQKFYEDLYKLLTELLMIEKSINPDYTMRQLALDNNLNEQFVYQILGWEKASPYLKKQVRNGKIGMRKAARLIRKVGDKLGEKRQDEAVREVIRYKMTDREMDKYVKKYRTEKLDLLNEREYNNNWNIARDISQHSTRFNRCLLAVNNLPKNQVANTLKILRTHKRLVCSAIDILERK